MKKLSGCGWVKAASVAACSVLFVSLFASHALALDSTWQGGVSDSWGDVGNWSNGIPMNAGDDARFNDPVAVTIPSTITLRTLYVNAPVTLTVASGATLNFSNNGGLVILSTADFTIDGDGDVTLTRNGTSDVDFADIRPAAGTTLTIAACISGLAGSGIELNAAGTLRLTNPLNAFTGYVRISTGSAIIQYTHPGALGVGGGMRFDQSSPSKISYIGSGAATVTVPVTLTAGTPLLENAGGGALTIDRLISATTTGTKTLNLASPTAQPIIVSGGIADGSGVVAITHAGPGPLTLNGTLAYTGATILRAPTVINGTRSGGGTITVDQGASLTFSPTAISNSRITLNADTSLFIEGGAVLNNINLDMAARSSISFNPSGAATFAMTLPLTNNLNGAGARWILPTAATASTVTVPNLIRAANASLDITADNLGTAANTLLVGNLDAGPLPGWLTVNGGPAVYDATLGVMPASAPGGTVTLTALGPATIPDDPTAAALINAQGTSGGITLAAPLTSIFSLTQAWAGDPAAVNFGGQTLAASLIDVTSGGDSLTLANGTLTALSDQTPPAGAAVFPALTAPPIAWFDFADSGTVSVNASGRIMLVENKGSALAALDAAVPPNYAAPLYVPNAVNGLGVARTDGNWPQQGLATIGLPGISGDDPRTLFLVASRSPVNANVFYAVYMGDDAANNNRDFAIVERPANPSFVTRGGDINGTGASPLGLNALTFITGLSTLSDRAGYRNGDLVGTQNNTLATTNTPLFILHRPGGNALALSGPGDVAEVIFFDYTLTDTEREAVEDYLMHKWGIAPAGATRGEASLALRNASPAAAFDIPAALAEPYATTLSLTKSGIGDVTLGGPVLFNGPLLITEGALTLDTPARHTVTLAKPVSGSGMLVKKGPGNLAFSATGTYGGGTLIQGGTVYQGNAAATLGTGPIRIENGGAFDIMYAPGQNVANRVAVEGFGPDGLGALRNSNLNTANQNAFVHAALTGDSAFYSANRFDVRNGSFDFGGNSLTLNGGGQFSIVGCAVSNVTPNVAVNVANGYFLFESTSDFKGSPANAVNVAPNASMGFYNLSNPFRWSVNLGDNSEIRASVGGMSTNVNVMTGPVALANGTARLNAIADGTLSIPSVISGPAGILKEGPGWVWLLNPANTYTGPTAITNGNLYAVSPGSLGTSGNISVQGAGASLIVRAASATSPDGWSEPAINAAISAAGTFEANTYLGLDTIYEDFLFSGNYPFVGLKKLGPHKLTLTGTAPDLGGITVYDGELDLSNTGDHHLHTYNIHVGAQPDAAAHGVLRLANTSLDTDDAGYNRAGPTLGVGVTLSSRGTLHIGEGARANGRLILGDAGTSLANASAGAVYQTSGVVTNNGGNGNSSYIGNNGYGYYRLDGGEIAFKGYTYFGVLNNSSAVYEQRGGTALLNPGTAPADGTYGDYYNGSFATRRGVVQFMLSGGSLDLSTHSFQLGEWGGDNTDGNASLTLENDAQMLGITTFTLANRNGAAEAYVTLNGGLLSVRDYFVKGGNNNNLSARAAIAFNGGTLRVSPPGAGAVSLVQTRANNTPPLLNVYPGGASIDIATASGHVTIDEPLRAPVNSGVTAVNVTNPGDGYIAPPAVYFSGGNGTGATAFAEIAAGKITAIRVTSPGVGYTSAPAVNFRGGGNTVNPAATSAIGLLKSGGLTKLGPGLLALNAENTYTGPTVVTDGTLRLGAGPETLSLFTAITLAGGSLDLGGATHTNIKPVTIESGALFNGTLAGTFTKTGPGTATIGAIPAPPLPVPSRENIIRDLGPIIWYDPSDTTPGNVTLNGTRVTRLRNKGTLGDGGEYDAIPYNNGAGPLLLTDNASCSPLGLGVLHVDNASANMTTAVNVPITGADPRTLVALLARDDGNFGVANGRACVGIGSGGNTVSWELGTDGSKSYLSGLTLDLDWSGATANVPGPDQLTFMAGNNGEGGDFLKGMRIWRCKGPMEDLETKPATWENNGNGNAIAAAPFSIARRGTGTGNGRGKYADILLFDRVLTQGELETLKDALMAKYVTGEEDNGNDGATPPVRVEEGTLVLASPCSEDTIARLNPLVWYDPSDAATVTLDSEGRITALASKGSKPNMDATSGGILGGTTPLLPPMLATATTYAKTYAKTGLPMIDIDVQHAGLSSGDNCGITGGTDRTTFGIFARHAGLVAGPVVSFGASNNGQLWEFGDRQNGLVLGGFGGGLNDLTVNPVNPVCTPDVFTFTYANQQVCFWRTLTDPTFATQGPTLNTGNSKVFIGQRPGATGRGDFYGQIGEVIIFARVLSETERTEVQDYLAAKWMTGEFPDGTEFDGVTFDVADGATLDLGGGERANITVTGSGTIANGILADGAVISPAGDNAIGAQTLHNVTLGAGSTYRLTIDGDLSDCLFADGDLRNLTIVPATDAPVTGKQYLVATGDITGKPALAGFDSKYKLIQKGRDLYLTSIGGTVLILR